jgi:hypothetical protein
MRLRKARGPYSGLKEMVSPKTGQDTARKHEKTNILPEVRIASSRLTESGVTTRIANIRIKSEIRQLNRRELHNSCISDPISAHTNTRLPLTQQKGSLALATSAAKTSCSSPQNTTRKLLAQSRYAGIWRRRCRKSWIWVYASMA